MNDTTDAERFAVIANLWNSTGQGSYIGNGFEDRAGRQGWRSDKNAI